MENDLNSKPKLTPPSLGTMVWKFGAELAAHAAGGFEAVPLLVYNDRITACLSCPSLLPETIRCGLCGCNMEAKAKWATASCPKEVDPLWTRYDKKSQSASTGTISEIQSSNTGDKQDSVLPVPNS